MWPWLGGVCERRWWPLPSLLRTVNVRPAYCRPHTTTLDPRLHINRLVTTVPYAILSSVPKEDSIDSFSAFEHFVLTIRTRHTDFVTSHTSAYYELTHQVCRKHLLHVISPPCPFQSICSPAWKDQCRSNVIWLTAFGQSWDVTEDNCVCLFAFGQLPFLARGELLDLVSYVTPRPYRVTRYVSRCSEYFNSKD